MLLGCLIAAITFLVHVKGLQEYTIYAPGGTTCPSCSLTLDDIIQDPQKYFASDTRLTFLPGIHMLNHNGPIVISDVSNLILQGNGELEDGFHWTVKQSSAIISCRSDLIGGFVFNRSSVHIILLTFTDCGLPIDTTYQYLKRRYAPFQHGLYSSAYNFTEYSNLWSTLYFVDSPLISLNQMSVQNCSGSCLYFLNTQTVNMNEVYIAHSSPDMLNQSCCTNPITSDDRQCVGGNAIFFYLSSPSCTDDTMAGLVVHNSSFSFGAGPNPANPSTIMAGVTVINLRSIELTAIFQSTEFYGNSGGNFGSLTIMSSFRFENISSLRANMYQCPSTPLFIAFKVSITNELLCNVTMQQNGGSVSSSVIIDNSYLAENTAIDSAGINIDTSYVVSFLQQLSSLTFHVSNTRIEHNRASIASCIGSGGIALYQGFATLLMDNVSMSGNAGFEPDDSPYIGIPPSCIVLFNTINGTFKDVEISDHELVGIVAISSNIAFQGDVIISNNTGINGGGLLMQQFSNMVLQPNSTVRFIDNRADFGAGIYISEQDIRAYIYENSQLCLYQVKENPSVSNSHFYFSGNEAKITGNAIYGGFIANCLLFFDSATSPSAGFTDTLFIVNSTNELRDISSNALRLCFCEDGHPQCDLLVYNMSSVFPGQTVNVSVVPVGQDGGLTTANMIVSFHFKVYSYTSAIDNTNASCMTVPLPVKLFETKNVTEFEQLLSEGIVVNFTIRLDSRSDLFETIPILSVRIPVNQCPSGFAINSSFVCQCESILASNADKDMISCDISNNTISHDGNIWIGFDTSEGVLLGDCPFDYCVHRPVSFDIINSPDDQCAYNRAGILCGGCADGYSLLLGSNECGKCPNNNYLSLLLVFGAAGIGLVVLLILLNLTVSVGTINGLIFYANIVQINESIFFPEGRIPVLSNFISFLNLDFGIKTCFYSGMTPYAKIWLQYVFPAYIWVIILTIIILSRYSVKLSKLVSSNAVPVLATLVLLTYTKLIRTYSSVFKIAYIKTGDNKVEDRWAVDGTLSIFSARHNFLLIFSLLVFLFIVLPFTVFVIVVPLFEKHLSTRCGRLWLQFLKPVSDAYSGPFTDSRRYWVGFGLIARIIVAICVPLLADKYALMVVFFVVLFLLSLFTLFGGYYKSKYLNYLEVWTNLNLITITVLALGGVALIATYITVSLMLLTFIGIVIFHIVRRITRLRSFFPPSPSRGGVKDASLGSFVGVDAEDTYRNNRFSTVASVDEGVDYEKYDNRFRESLMEYLST